jgi:hypothetical protein
MKHLHLLTLTFVIITLISCDAQNKQPNSGSDKPKKVSIVNMTSTDTTGELMKEDDFWKIIDNSQATSDNNYQIQISSLKQILTTLDPKEIVKFDNTFTALLAASYDYKLWGASYVINGGCSDDCFEYFREYLIAHGKVKFYETFQDPESCASWIKSEGEDNWEGIRYSASEAYKQKTGKDIPKTYEPKYELKGKPFDEANVDKQYPKLAKKFFGGHEE